MANFHARSPFMDCARTEQIVAHFIHRSLHLILQARLPASAAPPPPPRKKEDRWFNLALWDSLSPPLDPSLPRPVLDPLLVDVFLLHPDPDQPEPVLERWAVQYEHGGGGGGGVDHKKMYKRSLVLMRSVYAALRLLPAHRCRRAAELSCKVSSFGEPFTRAEEEGMRLLSFAPVETAHGRVSVSVTYRASLEGLDLVRVIPSPPQIIADYVGSPAAEPVKIFYSGACYSSTSARGYRSSSASSSPSSRPHSWTSGIHPPVPPPEIGGRKAVACLPIPRKKATSFDDHGFSPPCSNSPSPANSPFQSRLRSDCASMPVNISFPMTEKGGSRYLSPTLSDPNKLLLPPPSPRSLKGENSSGSPSRSFRRIEGFRGGDHYSGSSNLHGPVIQKVKESKDDSGRFSGVVSSNGSPRYGFSRSSSRLSLLSFQDDLDDGDMDLPFAVDDVNDNIETSHRTSIGKETSDSGSNHGQSSFPTSKDAAVGILVNILKNAAPLREDQSYISESSKSHNGDGGGSASSFFMSRKTSDALEELRSYSEMKDILSQGGSHLLESLKQNANSLSK